MHHSVGPTSLSIPFQGEVGRNKIIFFYLDRLLLGAHFTIGSSPGFDCALLVSVGEAPLDFFCNGVALFAGFTPLK